MKMKRTQKNSHRMNNHELNCNYMYASMFYYKIHKMMYEVCCDVERNVLRIEMKRWWGWGGWSNQVKKQFVIVWKLIEETLRENQNVSRFKNCAKYNTSRKLPLVKHTAWYRKRTETTSNNWIEFHPQQLSIDFLPCSNVLKRYFRDDINYYWFLFLSFSNTRRFLLPPRTNLISSSTFRSTIQIDDENGSSRKLKGSTELEKHKWIS